MDHPNDITDVHTHRLYVPDRFLSAICIPVHRNLFNVLPWRLQIKLYRFNARTTEGDIGLGFSNRIRAVKTGIQCPQIDLPGILFSQE